jgi:hypothetical protein
MPEPAPVDARPGTPPPPPAPDLMHIASLTVHADNVTIGEKKEAPSAAVKRRYQWNAGMLAALTMLVVFWFQAHLQSWATQKLLIGTASVWALMQLARSSIGKKTGDDAEKLRDRILAREGTRENLVFALIAAIGLLAFTSSLYLRLNDSKQQRRVRIDVIDEKGTPYMDSLVVEPSARIAGSLFVPRFRSRKLTVVVREPANYEFLRNPVTVWPWSAVELTFGDETQFAPKALHALRIVPGWALNGMEDPGEPEYEAIVTVGTESFRFSSLKFQTLYLGIQDKASLERIATEQTNDAFNDEINQHLQQHPGATDTAEYLTAWRSAPRIEPTRNFSSGESITVAIGIKGQPPLVTTQPVKIGAGEITTIFVEGNG